MKGFRRGREPPRPAGTQYEKPIGPSSHRSSYNPPNSPQNSHRPAREEVTPMTYQYGANDLPNPKQPVREEAPYMESQYGKNDLPNPRNRKIERFEGKVENVKSRFRNQGLVRRIKEYHDKRNAPATAQEVGQLKLNAEREKYKSDLQFYKKARMGQIGGPLIRNSGGGGGARRGSGQGSGYGFGSGMSGFGFGGNSILNPRGGMGGGMGMGGFGSGLDSLLSNRNPPVKRPVGRPPKQEQKKFGGGLDSLFGTSF